MEKYLKANRELWNAWAGFHPETKLYQMEAFRNGATSLMQLERTALEPVSGQSLLHLQCHFGQDTISWSRLGAKAVGVDFSEKAIATATSLANDMAVDTAFIEADVLQLDLGRMFDIVFTSYGVLTWLPDLTKWAEVVARHLKPGGTFFIAEFHPGLVMLDLETGKYAYSYFKNTEPFEETVTGSYADPQEGTARTEYSWAYSISEVLNALIGQGLLLESFEEYPYSPYDCFPKMNKRADGMYESALLKGVPHLFTLKMQKSV